MIGWRRSTNGSSTAGTPPMTQPITASLMV